MEPFQIRVIAHYFKIGNNFQNWSFKMVHLKIFKSKYFRAALRKKERCSNKWDFRDDHGDDQRPQVT